MKETRTHVDHFSYTELWFIGSQFPILLALCEYGFVLYWKKIEKKVQQTRKSIRKKIQSAPKLRYVRGFFQYSEKAH